MNEKLADARFSELCGLVRQHGLENGAEQDMVLNFLESPRIKPRLLKAPASTRVRYHHAYEGGLLDHTVEVIKLAVITAETMAFINMATERELRELLKLRQNDAGAFSADKESQARLQAMQAWYTNNGQLRAWDVVLAALFHDFNKLGDAAGVENVVPNILKSGKVSTAEPYEHNPAVNDFEGAIARSMPGRMVSDNERQAAYLLSRNKDRIREGEFSVALVAACAPALFEALRPEVVFAISHHEGMYATGAWSTLAGKETPLQLALHFADMVSSRRPQWAAKATDVKEA